MEKKEHIEIILEDMQSKLDLLIESNASLKTQIESNHREIKEELQLLKLEISYLNKKVDKVEDGLNRKITDLKSEISHRIDEVETGLTKRIDEVETKLTHRIDQVESTLTVKIDTVAADVAAHRADTEKHHTPYRVSE